MSGSDVVKGGLQPVDGGEVHPLAIVLRGDGLPDRIGVVVEGGSQGGSLALVLRHEGGDGSSALLGTAKLISPGLRGGPSLPQPVGEPGAALKARNCPITACSIASAGNPHR